MSGSQVQVSDPVAELFAGMPHTAAQHFTLYFYAALLRVLDHASVHFGSAEAATERLPFLSGYFAEIADTGLGGESFADAHVRWRDSIDAWERLAPIRLPLSALRSATGLTHEDLTLLAQVGLPDEDPRFGLVFEAMHGGTGERRATPGLLAASWHRDAFDSRSAVHRLHALGLIEIVSGTSAELRPNATVWNVLRGGTLIMTDGWARHRENATLPELDDLVLPRQLHAECARLPGVLLSGAARALIVRGPRHNGRATVAAAIARRMGKGAVEVSSLVDARDARWRTAASLACLLDAVLLVAAEPAPSESFELPALPETLASVFVTLGTAGGLTGALAEHAFTLRIPIPDRAARTRLWRNALGAAAEGLPYLRMTSGNIMRAASVARAGNSINGNGHPDTATLRSAIRTLERPGLEALARRVDATADWSQLAVSPETLSELSTLEARCRQRERLGAFVGEALSGLGPGVRALFKGPSGTGKTLAARLLAGSLEMDLYRVDLATVVNKYIGETEKNLERVFARAEELDVILLLDEGDALLTQRTGVQSANDRYANLETNYLLQRLESYEGILLITTNAGERIDTAFQRRIDVAIDFTLPDPLQRWQIWQLHLPATHHVDDGVLHSIAQRCALSGGQIRNIALHASLVALESESLVESRHLETAIEREYRKQGAVSPLRVRNGAR